MRCAVGQETQQLLFDEPGPLAVPAHQSIGEQRPRGTLLGKV